MKLRRILGLVLAMLMLVTCVCFTANADDATAKVVYLNGEYEGDGDGLTTRKPFNTLQKAFEAVKDGGTIVVCGDTTFKDKITTSITGDVVITGEFDGTDYETTLTFGGYTYFMGTNTGVIKFENIQLIQSENWAPTYFFNNNFELGEGVTGPNTPGVTSPSFILGGDGGGNGFVGGKMIVRSGKNFRTITLGCGKMPKEVNDISLEYYGGNVKFNFGFAQPSTVSSRPNKLANVNALIEAQPSNTEGFLTFTHTTEITGAVQILMNNGTAVEYALPEGVTPAGGLYVINSQKGGRVDFTETAGTFKISSTDYSVAVIASEEGEIMEYELEADGEECSTVVELAEGTYSISYTGDAPAVEEEEKVEEKEEEKPAAEIISKLAIANTQSVLVDGKQVTFEVYALKYSDGGIVNYIKLRDLAYILNGTAAQFEVSWDGAVNILNGKAYTPNGSEMSTPFSGDRAYTPTDAVTKVDGTVVEFDAICLTDDNGGAYNYYKLRDVGEALDFDVSWTAEKGIFIETDKSYTAD